MADTAAPSIRPDVTSPLASRPWVARYDPGVPATLRYPRIRMGELLRRTAHRFPDRPALIEGDRITSYAELDRLVDGRAMWLRELGIGPGQRVALVMPNSASLPIAFYALWRAGAVAVPVNPRATGVEIGRQLTDAGVVAVIAAERIWRSVDPLLVPPTVSHVVTDLEAVADGRGADRGSRRVPDSPDPSPAASDEPAVLLYTGGTTGLPKAAVLSHRNLAANAAQLGAWAADLRDGAEVMLSALPFAHGYALTACLDVAVARGWAQVLVPDPRDIDALLDAVERHRVTVFPGVPTLYAAIAAAPTVRAGTRDLRSIRACISGAAPLPSGIQDRFEDITGGRLVEGYGLTEASPATHCNPLSGRDVGPGIGLPLPDTDCRLVDVETEANDVAPGSPGVLCIAGPQVMRGYWQRPDDTAAALRAGPDGRDWLHTGDIAQMTPDGAFRIVDRKKDLIVASGGLKVYPNEIEEALSRHPKVALSAVIGVPVGGADQRAKAFVVLRDGMHADEAEIRAFLADRLASYKLPKRIEFRTELPLAFTGKVLRRVLADEERSAGRSSSDP
jgi:long-chain acyl-CoA synthetase